MKENFDGHPAYIRYPFLKPQPTDASYTPWIKWFAWKPVRCLDGERAWLRVIYKRQRTVKWTPPQFPPDAFNTTQYLTPEGLIEFKFK